MKTLSLVSRICCFLCVALMLALIIVQFMPNWTYEAKVKGEDGTSTKVETEVSLAEITWFPNDHKDLTKQWKTEYKKIMQEILEPGEDGKIDKEKLEFKMNGLVPMPILSMAAAAIGIFVCLFKNKYCASALLPLISGGAIVHGMMSHPMLQAGAQCQTFQILGIVTVAVAAVCLITGIVASIMGMVAAKKAAKK